MHKTKPLFAFAIFPLLLTISDANPGALRTASPEAFATRPGKDFALFIAVQDYDEWPDLGQPVADCEKIAAELKANYGFDTEILRNRNRAEILAAIDRAYNRQYDDDAQLLIFFSGHGYFDERKCKGYFIPCDGKKNDPAGASFIDYQALQGDIASIPCRHILLAVDACFGGTFDAAVGCNKNKGDDDSDRPQPKNRDERADFIRRTLSPESRLFFSSIGKESTSDNSRFARRWLDALQNAYDYRGLLPAFDLRARLRTGKEVFGTFGNVQNEDAFVLVRNLASNDRDGDGISNDRDDCPERYGTAANRGCPEGASPAPATDPDADLDGIPDDRDACPNRFGTAKANGCPDRDNDGVPDISDECPDAPGQPNWAGCPDTDGDGLHDGEDECPTVKGARADRGCPPPDRDNDGVPDKSDQCPDEAGKAYLEGCPERNFVAPEGMVFVQGGTFQMGGYNYYQVKVNSFYMSKYEVTIGEYLLFCDETKKNYPQWLEEGSVYNILTGSNDHYKENGMSLDNKTMPITGVSWYDAVAYCEWLSLKTGKNYRLPTEAEWEYAARGGQAGAKDNYIYAGGNHLDEVGWYKGNSGDKPHPVGGKKANQLGLFDMSGNVQEWCSDWYGLIGSTKVVTDPKGLREGNERVYRGGDFANDDASCHVDLRNNHKARPNYRWVTFGFRLVCQCHT